MAEPLPAGLREPLEESVTGAGGVRLHVRCWALDAPGAPVLAVHGLASNARLWDGVAGRLAALGHPVAAVDQRGHGRSEKPDSGYDFATLTQDLLAVGEALGWVGPLRRPVAAGQSWGGNVVLELAARHGDAVRSLVLVDGGTIELSGRFADWPTCQAALAPPEFDHLSLDNLRRRMSSRHPDWPAEGIEGTLANFDVTQEGTVRPWLTRPRHMAILRGLWEHRPSERYPLVSVPVMLVPASGPAAPDARWMAAKREEIARAEAGLETSLTRWLPGDHDLHAQHPAEVAQLIHAAADPSSFPAL